MKKISSTSTYNKVLNLLDQIRYKRFDSLKDLTEYMIGLNQEIYFVKIYKLPPIDTKVPEFSTNSIKKIIKLSITLELINDNGITEIGNESLLKNNFDKILSTQIIKLLNNNKITLNGLNKIINDFLKGKVPTLPTASELFKKIEDTTEISYLLFSKLVNLLSCTEYANTSQTKIYLEFKEN